MHPLTPLQPIDYLVIGHLTRDLTLEGPRMGGTAAYATLTARALGLRVGVITSWGAELPLGPLRDIPIVSQHAEASTTFENLYTPEGRVQTIYHTAPNLDYYLVPDPWRSPAIVHLGPVAQEVEPSLVRHFTNSFIGVTPQGWLREWDKKGQVLPCEWPEATFVLRQVGAAVLSIEDISGDEDRIQELAASCPVLAVTENIEGARVYWHGDVRRFRSLEVEEVDPTGAGDIFAAAFFTRLYSTRDPWEAGRFATQLASYSVTRPGLEGIPTPEEIKDCMIEVY